MAISTPLPQPAADQAVDHAPPGPRRGRGRRRLGRRIAAWVVGGACLLVAGLWLGLRVQPSPLPAPQLTGAEVRSTSLPDDLPAPVARFYRALYGEEIPVIESIVVSGRGSMRIQGVTFPSRYRFSHVTGEAYRHYIETTVFGARLLAVNEWFVEGTAMLELPFGVSQGPKVDQGANLALWAELVWAPSVWVTDPAVAWRAVDETTALLLVPFGEETETFTVSFDPASGMLNRMESLRFKGEQDEAKAPWINEILEWGELGGRPVPLVTAVTWGDEGSPWAVLRTEEVLYNTDLSAYITASGP